ncbi:MAG: PID-CTERM protein-sorting domain-containing protein [Chitinophagaceae bacterium]
MQQQKSRLYKQAIRSFVLALMVVMLAIGAQAQNPDPWDDADSADVPLDGGLSLLVAAGAGYGIKKYRDNKQQRSK